MAKDDWAEVEETVEGDKAQSSTVDSVKYIAIGMIAAFIAGLLMAKGPKR